MNGGKRCTLQQFLVYTWGEKTKGKPLDIERPTAVERMEGDIADVADLEGKTFEQIFQWVNTAVFDTGIRVYYNADPQRVNGKPNFQESLAAIGDPINNLKTNPPEGADASRVEMVVDMGEDAVNGVMGLRMKNLEQFRIDHMMDLFDEKGYYLETKPASTGIASSGNFRTLDIDGTITENVKDGHDEATIRQALDDAMESYRTLKPENAEHIDGLHAARQAVIGCGCARPNFALKKRSPVDFTGNQV
jgi:hypothetical protein